MALLDDVRLALRVTSTVFDDEIQDLIDACKFDLATSGIITTETDKLIKRAITIYVKSNFGMSNDNADRFDKSYELLKQHLVLSSDYKEVTP